MGSQVGFLEIALDKDRIYGLDILRALSILFVIIAHGNEILDLKPNPLSYLVFDGVSIFFVLSGFLIGGILIKILERGKPSVACLFNFYIKRWFRTLPNYFLVLLVLVAIEYYLTSNFEISRVSKYFYFSQNLFTIHPDFFPEAWSLSVEEWFYLIIPAILFFMVGACNIPVKKSVLILSLTILLMTVLFRYYRFSGIPIGSITEFENVFRKQVLTRFDSLMCGLIGAYIAFYHQCFWIKHKNKFFIAGLSIFFITKMINIIVPERNSMYYCVFYFFVIATATLFLLPFLSGIKSGKGCLYRYISYISICSYSMYLVNYTLVKKFMLGPLSLLQLSGIPYKTIKYILFWVITYILSVCVYKYFEKPTTDLRDYLSLNQTHKNELVGRPAPPAANGEF